MFDQLRRAVVSVEANIVEGYALGTTPQLRRHLKIALGSAAEAECLLRTSHELDCLPADEAKNLLKTSAALLKVLYGFWRRSCSTSAP